VLADSSRGPDAVVIATGSEVALALEARERLAAEGLELRVVSMPSLELFAAQDAGYRTSVLPPGVPTVAVEAGVTLGWDRWAGVAVGIDRFGASVPGPEALERLGITADRVGAAVRRALTSRAASSVS